MIEISNKYLSNISGGNVSKEASEMAISMLHVATSVIVTGSFLGTIAANCATTTLFHNFSHITKAFVTIASYGGAAYIGNKVGDATSSYAVNFWSDMGERVSKYI